jgi:hypothetical protein
MTMKWGTKFKAEYPNLIHRMAKKYMPCEFNSYCMTDDPTGLDKDIIAVECTEQWLWNDILEQDQWYFWDGIKMSLFAPNLCGIEGKILFTDLDNLFLSPMDRIVNTPTPAIIGCDWMPPWHVGMHGGNYFLTMLFNASLIYVDNTDPITNEIWNHFNKNYKKIKQSLYSTDAYLWRKWRDQIHTYPKGTVYSFNRGADYPDNHTIAGSAAKYKYRPDYSVCVFMEDHEPDPLDIHEGWVAREWKQYLEN